MENMKKSHVFFVICIGICIILSFRGSSTYVVDRCGYWSRNVTDGFIYPTNTSDNVNLSGNQLLNANLSIYAGDNIVWDSINMEFDGQAGGSGGGNPFNQDLNTTNDVIFHFVTAHSFFGDGGNLTNITASGDGYAGAIGHPHNQDLNTTSNVEFAKVTTNNVTSGSFYGNGDNLSFTYKGARAYKNANQNIANGVTTIVIFGAESYDYGNCYSTFGSTYLVDETGLYLITYSVGFTGCPDLALVSAGIQVNGYFNGGTSRICVRSGFGGVDIDLTGSDIVYLAKGQYINIAVTQFSGGVLVMPNTIPPFRNQFSVSKLDTNFV